MSYVWILLISGFLGWLAGWIAIKMLFHRFAKKKRELAEKLGKLVSRELFSFDEIEQKVTDPANFRKIMPYVDGHIDQFLRVKLVEQMPMIGMLIGEKTIIEMKKVFTGELETLFPVIMKNYMETLKADLNMESIIIEKIAGFSSDGLERVLYPALKKELRFVQITGALLGLAIGLVQVFISCIL